MEIKSNSAGNVRHDFFPLFGPKRVLASDFHTNTVRWRTPVYACAVGKQKPVFNAAKARSANLF